MLPRLNPKRKKIEKMRNPKPKAVLPIHNVDTTEISRGLVKLLGRPTTSILGPTPKLNKLEILINFKC